MQKQYTQKARKALELAARLSQKMHHNYIGTEHNFTGTYAGKDRGGSPGLNGK